MQCIQASSDYHLGGTTGNKIKSVGHSHKTLFEDAPTHVFTLISCCRQKWMFRISQNIKSAVIIVWCLLNEEASMFTINCIHLLLDVSSLGWLMLISIEWYRKKQSSKILGRRHWENAVGSENTERSLGRKYHGKWDSEYVFHLNSIKSNHLNHDGLLRCQDIQLFVGIKFYIAKTPCQYDKKEILRQLESVSVPNSLR